MWCRVFALSESAPNPEVLTEFLRGHGDAAECKCDVDDKGWFHLELTTSAGVYVVDRYFADEGIRDDLNTWAAWLEQHAGKHADRLMQHMISTRQLITIRRDDRGDDAEARRFCHELARMFAAQCEAVYQIDGEGFFDATKGRLVAEVP